MGSADIRVDIPRYAELYLDGELNLDSLISRQIKLSEINDGFDEMRRGSAARSVITAWD
jgi:S-(hydroxymethyl)glutathione dehydrogenase/alcohol dehydrogenase